MFSGHKHFYFVLQNESEIYYKDSLLALKIEDYIWFNLQKSGYSNIFFINTEPGDKVSVSLFDEASYEKNSVGGLGLFAKNKLWDTKKSSYSSPVTEVTSEQLAAKWMLERIAEEKTALVCTLNTVDKLFSHDKDLKEKFVQLLSSGKGSLILRYPMEPDADSLDLLVGENSIFCYKSAGGVAFKTLYALLTGNSAASVFDELKKSAPEQMIELGYLDFESIKTLIANVAFALGKTFGEAEFLDHVNYLFYWLENEKVRRDSGGLFSGISGAVTRKKLFDALTKKDAMTAFCEREKVLQARYKAAHKDAGDNVPLSQILFAFYGPKNTNSGMSHVMLEDMSLRKLYNMPFPEKCAAASNGFAIRQVQSSEWEEMKRDLCKPRNRRFEPERAVWIERFLSYVSPAEVCSDSDTLRRTVNMLMYCGNNLYTVSGTDYGLYCENGRKYLELSKEYFSLKQEILKLEEQKISETNFGAAQISAAKATLKTYYDSLVYFDSVMISTGAVSSGKVGNYYAEAAVAYEEQMETVLQKTNTLQEEADAMTEEEAWEELKKNDNLF